MVVSFKTNSDITLESHDFSKRQWRKLCKALGAQDFDNSSRWSIICTEIVRFNSDQYYSFWSEVGLTEMQENEWYDQKPLIARQKKIEKLIWVEEKIENETNP